VTAISNLIAAITYALRIWSVNAYYNLTQRIDADAAKAEQERDRLRRAGDPASQLAADRVQNSILRRAGIYVPEPPLPERPAAGATPPGRENS